MHGDKSQEMRKNTLEEFKSSKVRLLIATDVSARGIDIPDVDYVINYDLPELPENYVHRVGRTGRAHQKGEAIAFCSEHEQPLLQEIEFYLGKKIELLTIQKNDYLDTLELTKDTKGLDWKALIAAEMKKAEEDAKKYGKKPHKKRKKRP